MSIQLVKAGEQGRGQFNNGEILEYKPIGFPQDGGKLKPYSNLFYWAHAWTDTGSTIGEHPHQGFEILSFVLEGSIEHYDNKQEGWNVLNKGDAQVIRSGNGISHAEKLNKGAHMFQIWFDPDLSKAINKPASYNDYQNDQFYIGFEQGHSVKVYAGPKGIMKLDTPGIVIKEYSYERGMHSFSMNLNNCYSLYIIDGEGEIINEDQKVIIEKEDFVVMKKINLVNINFIKPAIVFVIISKIEIPYKTYPYL